MTQKAIAILALLGLVSAPLLAADKSAFTLFNPTPADQMREMNTDRPDVTESPFTVDAGHIQLEFSLFEYTRDNETPAGEEINYVPFNLKLGLTNNIDLQLVGEPYLHDHFGGETRDGIGDTQLRLKINFWGNDGGETAFGIMPFIQFPTAADDLDHTDHIEGGLIVPFSIKLPADFELNVMAEFDALRDDADESYGVAFLHTASLYHPLTDKLNGYVEYVGTTSENLGESYVALAGGGFTYAISPNMQFDTGVYFGLSRRADDFRTFVGFSVRL